MPVDTRQSHCINRNIVECKEKYEKKLAKEQRSINRNIVECKERREP